MPLGGHPRVAAQRLDGQFARVRPSEGYGVECLAIPGEADIAGVTVVEYPLASSAPADFQALFRAFRVVLPGGSFWRQTRP